MRRHGLLALVLPAALAAFTACGKESKPEGTPAVGGYPADSTRKEAPPPVPSPAPAPAPAAATPSELGAAAGSVYVDTMRAVVEAMAGDPAPADLRTKLEALKSAAIPKLVDLGRKRGALGPADKAAMDSSMALGLSGIPSSVFEAYSKGQSAYAAKDRELGELISSFNVLTQYANFDLLKQQAPDEAKRLGLE